MEHDYNHPDYNHPDHVDRAAAALRSASIPPGPSEELLARTVARLQPPAALPFIQLRRKSWFPQSLRRSAIAAAATVIAAAGIILLVMTRSSSVGFAQVLEQLSKARAVSCDVNFTMSLPGMNPRTIAGTAKMLMVEPGWVITTQADQTLKINESAHKLLVLNEKEKHAVIIDLTGTETPPEKTFPNFLERFKGIDAQGAKSLGRRQINDRDAAGFLTAEGTEIWADPQSHLPVLIRVQMNSPTGNSTFTLENINWDPVVDPALTSLDIPKGYTTSAQTMDTSQPTEQDVINLLRHAAQINNNTFPDGVSVTEILPIISQWSERQGLAPENKASPDKRAKVISEIIPIARGWAYMMNADRGSQWHYAGKGLRAGESSQPILWYQPAKDRWRAFAADFTVRDIAFSELPPGRPVNLDLFSAAAAMQNSLNTPPEPVKP